MLPRLDRRDPDLDVGARDGEVHHDLDTVVREELREGPGSGDPERLGLDAGPHKVEVGDEPDVEVRERGQVAEVLGADGAGAHHADADPSGFRHASPSRAR